MREAQMNTLPTSAQSECVVASLSDKPVEASAVRAASLKKDQLPAKSSRPGKLPLLGSYLIPLLIGVAGTLVWQTYGDATIHMLASAVSSPGRSSPDHVSPDQQQFNAMSLDLDAMRQSIAGLATNIATNQERIMHSVEQLTAGQEQITREVAKLQAVDHNDHYGNLDPPPRPAPAPAPKSVPRPSQAPAALIPAKTP
jgi:hypothetical protein